MTSTEFIKWIRYLEWRDVEEFRREDFYLAQIAAQIERANVKHPSQVTIQKKLLKFTTREPPQKVDGRVQQSKAYWLSLTRARRRAETHLPGVPSSGGPNTQGERAGQKQRGGRRHGAKLRRP